MENIRGNLILFNKAGDVRRKCVAALIELVEIKHAIFNAVVSTDPTTALSIAASFFSDIP